MQDPSKPEAVPSAADTLSPIHNPAAAQARRKRTRTVVRTADTLAAPHRVCPAWCRRERMGEQHMGRPAGYHREKPAAPSAAVRRNGPDFPAPHSARLVAARPVWDPDWRGNSPVRAAYFSAMVPAAYPEGGRFRPSGSPFRERMRQDFGCLGIMRASTSRFSSSKSAMVRLGRVTAREWV